jgi:hypothetical protein
MERKWRNSVANQITSSTSRHQEAAVNAAVILRLHHDSDIIDINESNIKRSPRKSTKTVVDRASNSSSILPSTTTSTTDNDQKTSIIPLSHQLHPRDHINEEDPRSHHLQKQ